MHSKKIINNSLISITYKLFMLCLGFVTRKIFIVYLGEEILGLNSLYTNLLGLLNLADFGIGVAVQYQLYEPLVNKDYIKISKILTATRKLYNRIGCIIFLGGGLLSLIIQHLIKATTYPIWYIRIAFMISVTGVAAGYFFVHKRIYLEANEEIGIINIVDLITKMIIVIISLITTILFSNYYLYLIINVLHGITSNLVIHFLFKSRYPAIQFNLSDVEIERKDLVANLGNVIPMKISNYVYNSTDNVVISKILGLTTVAIYSNYMTIINGLMGIEYLFGNVMISSMGKIIKEVNDKGKIFEYYLVFQYVQYLMTSFFTISLTMLCTPFIKLWVGDQFLVKSTVFYLLIVDFYIHSMYQPAYVMFGAAGKFKDDKYITLASAGMNIVISIFMVNIIGLSGVIIGTLVTDIYILIVRTYQMVKLYFRMDIFDYIKKIVNYTICMLIGLLFSGFLCHFVLTDSMISEFLIKAVICLIMANGINLIFTKNTIEFNQCMHFVKRYFSRGDIR